MRFRLTALAGGSSGNAFLLQAGETSLLIDCGLPARQMVRELQRRGVPPEALAAILLTHEHGDHTLSAGCSPGVTACLCSPTRLTWRR